MGRKQSDVWAYFDTDHKIHPKDTARLNAWCKGELSIAMHDVRSEYLSRGQGPPHDEQLQSEARDRMILRRSSGSMSGRPDRMIKHLVECKHASSEAKEWAANNQQQQRSSGSVNGKRSADGQSSSISSLGGAEPPAKRARHQQEPSLAHYETLNGESSNAVAIPPAQQAFLNEFRSFSAKHGLSLTSSYALLSRIMKGRSDYQPHGDASVKDTLRDSTTLQGKIGMLHGRCAWGSHAVAFRVDCELRAVRLQRTYALCGDYDDCQAYFLKAADFLREELGIQVLGLCVPKDECEILDDIQSHYVAVSCWTEQLETLFSVFFNNEWFIISQTLELLSVLEPYDPKSKAYNLHRHHSWIHRYLACRKLSRHREDMDLHCRPMLAIHEEWYTPKCGYLRTMRRPGDPQFWSRLSMIVEDGEPIAIAAYLTRRNNLRLDEILIVAVMLRRHFGRLLETAADSDVESTIHRLPYVDMPSHLAYWWSCNDQSAYVSAVFLNPYIRTSLFRGDQATFPTIWESIGSTFKRIFRDEPSEDMHTACQEYFDARGLFSYENMLGADYESQDFEGNACIIDVWTALKPPLAGQAALAEMATHVLSIIGISSTFDAAAGFEPDDVENTMQQAEDRLSEGMEETVVISGDAQDEAHNCRDAPHWTNDIELKVARRPIVIFDGWCLAAFDESYRIPDCDGGGPASCGGKWITGFWEQARQNMLKHLP